MLFYARARVMQKLFDKRALLVIVNIMNTLTGHGVKPKIYWAV